MQDQTALEELAAQVAAGLKAQGWSVKRKEAKLHVDLGNVQLYWLSIDDKDQYKSVAELVEQAHRDLVTMARGRGLQPQSEGAERVVSRDRNIVRAELHAKSVRAGKQRSKEEG